MPASMNSSRYGILELKNLSKSFGKVQAVNDLSFRVRDGEIFGLLGPNGAGKTTTINLIAGFLKQDRGEVLIHGKPLSGQDFDFRKEIGICPQENVHWKRLTVVEQLQFLGDMYGLGKTQIRHRIQLLLEALGLSEVSSRLGGNLSGGMQRRLNIGLALIHDPEIVILDEPEAGLDPQSRIDIRHFIKSLAGEKTIILTTHNMDEADRLADRLAIMDQGKLLVLDTPQALKATVGEGDVLEIICQNISPDFDLEKISFNPRMNTRLADGRLQIRALDLPNLLPEILSALDRVGLQAEDIRLRKNSLEDVFIQLTGRRLQE